MKILGWVIAICALLLFIGAAIAAKGPLTGSESITIYQITMDQSGNCQAQYQVIFGGDVRYTRYGTVNFNTIATKQIVSDALVAANAQEGL